MPKKRHARQRPPKQSQTQRPVAPKELKDIRMPPVGESGRTDFPVSLPKKARLPKLRKGHLPLTAFEQAMFRGMMKQGQQLQAEQAILNRKDQELRERHSIALEALGKTHGMDFDFNVELNQKGTALNWTEVKNDGPQGDTAATGGEAPAQGD